MLLIDKRAQASNPGRMRVNRLRVIRFHLWAFIPLGVGLALLAIGLYFRIFTLAGIGFALGVIITALMIRSCLARFQIGCICPGKVISIDPILVATSSDMSTGTSGNEYIIVAIDQINPAAFPFPPSIGDLCPACALYAGFLSRPAWEQFHPEPVWIATSELSVVDAIADRMHDADWDQLQHALKKVVNPMQPGRYRVDISEHTGGNNGWAPEQLLSTYKHPI